VAERFTGLRKVHAVTASQQAFGQLTLTPHRMGADTFYTKQLLNQASLSVEAFVRDDLARQMAVELDRVYINGIWRRRRATGNFEYQQASAQSLSRLQ
jgi:HK97 family phage major capsid protein